MRAIAALEKSKNFWFLFLISFIFFILRFPSFFEPYWYGDEGIYHVLGDAMNKGAILYRDIWDNKPPFLYLTYSIFQSDQFLIRFVSTIFGVLSVILFFLLSKRLFQKTKTMYLTTSLFAVLFALPLLEGNIANAENFMLAPIIGSSVLIFKFLKNKDSRLLLFSGILLSVAFLFKIVAIFDFAAFLLFLAFIDNNILLDLKSRKLTSSTKRIVTFILGFLLPTALVTTYFVVNGAFTDFLRAAFFANISYVDYGNRLFISQGLLFLKLIILAIFSLLIFSKRKILKKEHVFILLWFGFSLFNAFFSQRPYTHYLLVLLPSMCALVGLTMEGNVRRNALSLLGLSMLLILINFGYYGKTLFYYQNFLSFMQGNKNIYNYYKFFDRRTITDYELGTYIRNNTSDNDSVFIWGNNAQVYTLTKKLPPGRYAVAYHITSTKDGIKETQEDLNRVKPKLIIVMPYMKSFPFQVSNYSQKIIIDDVIILVRENASSAYERL